MDSIYRHFALPQKNLVMNLINRISVSCHLLLKIVKMSVLTGLIENSEHSAMGLEELTFLEKKN